jgi:hypothetical protein
MGPMTGRGAGFCGGGAKGGNAARGRCFAGRGQGGGRGWRNGFNATGLPGWMRFGQTAPAETERDYLQGEVQVLQQQLEAMQARLQSMKNDGPAEKE